MEQSTNGSNQSESAFSQLDKAQQACGDRIREVPEEYQWYLRGMVNAFRLQAEGATLEIPFADDRESA